MKEKFKKLEKNKGYRIVKSILKAMLSLLIVLLVSVIFIQRVSNNNLTVFGYRIFTIVTESMVPKYKVGDMILSRETDINSLNIGEEVVYMGASGDFKDKIVTHQIIKIDETKGEKYFHTKGLANSVEDPIVTSSQIMGRVVYKFKILSMLSKLINNMYGFYFIVFVPFVVLLFFEIMDVIHAKEKKMKSN